MKHFIHWPHNAKHTFGHNLRQYKASQKKMGIRFLQKYYGMSKSIAKEFFEHIFQQYQKLEQKHFITFDLSLNPESTEPVVAIFLCDDPNRFFEPNYCKVSFAYLPTKEKFLGNLQDNISREVK